MVGWFGTPKSIAQMPVPQPPSRTRLMGFEPSLPAGETNSWLSCIMTQRLCWRSGESSHQFVISHALSTEDSGVGPLPRRSVSLCRNVSRVIYKLDSSRNSCLIIWQPVRWTLPCQLSIFGFFRAGYHTNKLARARARPVLVGMVSAAIFSSISEDAGHDRCCVARVARCLWSHLSVPNHLGGK